MLARRRADVTRAWVAALHFDYDGRFLCYSFGMGECNDLGPAVNVWNRYVSVIIGRRSLFDL